MVLTKYGALGFKNAYHFEQLVANTQLAPHWRLAWKHLCAQVGPHHGDIASAVEIAGGEEAPLGNLKLTNRQKLRCNTEN